jgi:predicted nucleic acid-binding protein
LNVVCDASTLIALARIGQLDILRQVGAQVVIPTAVYEEVMVKGAGKPGSDEMRQASWVDTHEVSGREVVAQFHTVLGAGESEAIALAKEIDADLIILDDEDARETAIAEGLNVVGLLAFLVLTKEEGIIHQVRPLLDALRHQGFFISDDLYHHILQKADES